MFNEKKAIWADGPRESRKTPLSIQCLNTAEKIDSVCINMDSPYMHVKLVGMGTGEPKFISIDSGAPLIRADTVATVLRILKSELEGYIELRHDEPPAAFRYWMARNESPNLTLTIPLETQDAIEDEFNGVWYYGAHPQIFREYSEEKGTMINGEPMETDLFDFD